jgi:hypothetical protein
MEYWRLDPPSTGLYDIGSPVFTDVWVSSTGSDAATGTSRAALVASLRRCVVASLRVVSLRRCVAASLRRRASITTHTGIFRTRSCQLFEFSCALTPDSDDERTRSRSMPVAKDERSTRRGSVPVGRPT